MTADPKAHVDDGAARQRRTLGGGAAVMLMGRLGGRAIHFVTQAVVGAVLGPAWFGVYALCWSVLRSLGLIATLGMHNAVIRFGAAGRSEPGSTSNVRRLADRTVAIACLGGVAAGAVLFGVSDWIGASVFQIQDLGFALRITAVVLPALTVTLVASAATRVTQRMAYSVVVEDAVQPGVNLALVLIAVLGFGWGLTGSLIALLVSYAASAVVALRMIRTLFPIGVGGRAASCQPVTGILRYAVPTALAGALGNYAVWVDRFFLGYFRPAAEVGLYQAAAQVAGLFALILTAFNAILGPMIAEAASSRDVTGMATTFKAATKWGVYLSTPAVLVVVFASRDVLVAVFGSGYADASRVLLILLGGQFVNLATGAVGITLMLTGHQRRWLAITALGAVVNAVLNVLLIPPLGAEGAAIATATTLVLVFPMGAVDVYRRFGVLGVDRTWGRGLIAAAGAALALVGVSSLDVAHPVLNVLLHGAVASVCFVGVLIAVDRDGEERRVAAWMWTQILHTTARRSSSRRVG